MLPKVANHLFLHTSRAVTLVQNQSGALRNVLQSGPASSTVPWGSGAGSSWGSTGAGPGGAKFNAGSKFYSGYTGPGRAITQANASSAQDGAESKDDDKDEAAPAFVPRRPAPSRPARSLPRRHSLSLPANELAHEQPTRTAVLQTVQKQVPILPPTHLSKRYNALLSSGGFTPSLGTYVHMINDLTDRDHEVQKNVRSLDSRTKRVRLWGQSTEVSGTETEKKRAELLAEENFQTAMKLFDAACVSVASSSGTEAGKTTNSPFPIASQFPISVYHGLLRSCAYHASIDAAIRVYAHLEARTHSDSSPEASSKLSSHLASPETGSIRVSTLVLYHLLSTYVNAGDLAGAKEVFSEFQDLSARDGLAYLETKSKVQADMWNKMMEAYFKVGQPAGALRLLEQMLDAGSKGGQDTADAPVPRPSASTFTTILNGFCNPSSPAKPDVATALSWFDRLLLQPTRPSDPYDPVDNPTRPDQASWTVMLESLARSVLENDVYIDDLNRLFDVFVERASDDGLTVRAVDKLMVLHANAMYLERLTPDEDEGDVKSQAQASLRFIAKHFPRSISTTSRSVPAPPFLADTLVRSFPYFMKYGMVEEGLELVEALATFEQMVLQKAPERENPLPRFAREALTKIAPFALEKFASLASTDHTALPQALHIMRLAEKLDVSPTQSMVAFLLDGYLTAPASARKELGPADTGLILTYAITLPAKYSSGDCAYTTLPALLQTMHDSYVWIGDVSSKVKLAVTDALYASFSGAELAELFAGLNSSFKALMLSHVPLKEAQDQAQRTIPSLPQADVSPPTVITIDAGLSRYIDEWFPSHPALTVYDAYRRLQKAVSSKSPQYPHPVTLARLINGLGRAHDIPAVQSVYRTAQEVIFSPFLSENLSWQTQAWFQIEDNMIIAYAHAGDMNAAFSHRDRITAAGGVPSPDAYGSLIECVKDTTDDTSNAMGLFAECQMLGTKPNVYLYNTIISKLAKARKADFALELFQQMKANSLRPSSITYGAVIAACARVGDAQAAEGLFEEMASQPNFKPRIPPYNTMMQMYAHTKPDRERVLVYYERMKKACIQPSAHTYKLLIDTYGTIEPIDVAAMENVFNELQSNSNIKLQGSHWAALINAYGCVLKDLDKAISVFDSIAAHPSSKASGLPDAVTYESLINVLVTHKRMDLVQTYIGQLQAAGVHMTAYIANLLIKGHAASGNIEASRGVFESLADPPSGIAAPNNHVPHDASPASPILATSVSYREPSTWEAMFRAELGNGDRDRAVALLERLQQRQFPPAVYNRIRGIMLDDSVSPWSQSPTESSPSPS